MLRAIPAEFAGVGWPAEYSNSWALCTCSFRRIVGSTSCLLILPRPFAPALAYSVSKSEVLALPGIVDHWFAVGMVDTAEYRLDTRRVWLYGAASGRWAVIMSFAPPGGPLDDTVLAGYVLHARLHFYPGAGQFRALVGEQTSATAAGRCRQPNHLRRTRSVRRTCRSRSVGCSNAGGDQCSPVPGPGLWRMRAPAGECCEIIDLPDEPWPCSLVPAASRSRSLESGRTAVSGR